MMRLPLFDFRAPRTIDEAARILDGEGTSAMVLAGGTDLLPNMKRRQQVPQTLISLRHVEGLSGAQLDHSSSRLGACLTLTEIAKDRRFRNGCSALWQAASLVATPHIRNMATLGGNICLDTRCLYYDQNYEWRKAIDFCKKKDGEICWVATGSSKCMAVSSTDTAPALIALGASVRLQSSSGEREILLADLYNNDGMNYITRQPNEILTEIRLGSLKAWKSTYWKLRRRGSFDFPVRCSCCKDRQATRQHGFRHELAQEGHCCVRDERPAGTPRRRYERRAAAVDAISSRRDLIGTTYLGSARQPLFNCGGN